MNRYLTEKASKAGWWEWPVMLASGLLLFMGLEVVVEDFNGLNLWMTLFSAALFLGMLSAPLFFTLRKRVRRRQARKMAQCLARLRNSSITFGELSRRSGIHSPESKLEWMLGKGWIQNIALDHAHVSVRVIRDGDPGAAATPSESEASAPSEAPEAPAPILPQTGISAYDAKLAEIRALNDDIANKAVSDKIDRIEALTADIFQLIAEHPERADEIRRFVNYYLPTTLKLLKSYSLMEKQRYQGENIQQSRRKIEEVLDQIIDAIGRQQDMLFQADALDVETDISVLKTMMSADGLTENGGLHT